MTSRNIWITVIAAIVVIGVAWFFLDHRFTRSRADAGLIRESDSSHRR